MIRYVIFAVIFYLIYMILKMYFNNRKKSMHKVKNKEVPPYDRNDIEDAEFRVVNSSDNQGDNSSGD